MYDLSILKKEEPVYQINNLKALSSLDNTFDFDTRDQKYICSYLTSKLITSYPTSKEETLIYLTDKQKCITIEQACLMRNFDMLLFAADDTDGHLYYLKINKIYMAN